MDMKNRKQIKLKTGSEYKTSISILMSVYNTKEKYLRKAIESMLSQSFKDYEFIIFNDCSDESTTAILREYQDQRIKLIENAENRGLTKNLNTGIMMAQGKYIARMDADDISMPERLKTQYTYMERHPDVDILGGEVIWDKVKDVCCRYLPQEWRRVTFLFHNCGIFHPTAFFRTSFLKENKIFYNEEYDKTQDYELWTRALRVGKLAVCREIVLYYRRHDAQISAAAGTKSRQQELDARVRKNLLTELIPEASEDEYDQLLDLDKEILPADRLSGLFSSMVKANHQKRLYSMYYLRNELALRWFWILRGKMPRRDRKEYMRGYWFRYLFTPRFLAYYFPNKCQRILCKQKRVRRNWEDKFS